MGTSTSSKRRLATAASIAGALTILVPVAQADSSFRGSPDAIDRALAAQQLEKVAAIDARERSMLTRPGLVSEAAPPDAFERALQNRATGISPDTISMLDAREQSLAARPVGAVQPTVSDTAFDWADFGIGAGAGIGFMLVLGALGIGVLATRRDHEGISPA